MMTTLPYSPAVRFYDWVTQAKKKLQQTKPIKTRTKKPKQKIQQTQNTEERTEGHLIDLHGDLELHIKEPLMYFRKWNKTVGFSVLKQIIINLNILKGIGGEKLI